jgi:hypothetical protein
LAFFSKNTPSWIFLLNHSSNTESGKFQDSIVAFKKPALFNRLSPKQATLKASAREIPYKVRFF